MISGRGSGGPLPTVFTHAVVGLVLGRALARERWSVGFAVVCAASAALPDADALFHGLFDAAALDPFEHRGLTHSLAFAAGWALLLAFLDWRRRPDPTLSDAGRLAGVLAVVTASHGMLDGLTDGGSGVRLLLPFADTEWFAPWRPIPVAPIDARQFFGPWGARVLSAEVVGVWLPALAALGAVEILRRRRSPQVRM
jgi:inner membrane protein